MLYLFCWLVYGLLVGTISKLLHPGEDPVGLGATTGIGIAGSFIGGFISWLIGLGDSPFNPSGILMGVVGGVIFCMIYRSYRIRNFVQAQGRMPKMFPKK